MAGPLIVFSKAIENIDHSRLLLDGVGDARGHVLEDGGIGIEELDLDGFGGVGQVPNHVLQDLGELDVKLRFCLLDFAADIGDDFVDTAIAFRLELDSNVAGVGFGDGGEAHLEAGAARDAIDFGSFGEDSLDVLENAIRLGERTAGRHDVVENETALVHFGQQVGSERRVADVNAQR